MEAERADINPVNSMPPRVDSVITSLTKSPPIRRFLRVFRRLSYAIRSGALGPFCHTKSTVASAEHEYAKLASEILWFYGQHGA